MELLTSEARRVWIPDHPTHGYLPGRVDNDHDASADGMLWVVDDKGGSFKVPHAEALAVDPACLTGVEDLLTLGDFNEAALLHNIRVRYGKESIYTGIGNPILISVNPYQHIPGLYSQERQREYRKTASRAGQLGGPPVHLYSVADAAYRAMLQEQASQSIIISGESGAGKTEATKRILAYLAEMQSSASKAEGKRRSVEQQVLDANPVLEAFGNAKTARNDNSSRFGKFVEVEFDAGGKLLSAQISNYLLEKCRIVTQQPEERNYHIFYQICAAAARNLADLPQGMKLAAAVDFEYTQACDSVSGVDDAAEFKEVLDCMMSLGFSQVDRDSVLKVVAAVLHLGNLKFSAAPRGGGQDGAVLEDDSKVALICELLAVDPKQLRQVLEYKCLEDPLTKKTIHMPHDVNSASFTRHSLAKVVYAKLFDWLVWRINESISNRGQQKDLRRIGLLDIYGFEVFEWNSFEQLCINFANEKLQQHFNTHMFTLEQRLYSAEGIAWSHITFQDNQHIIDSLDKKPLGLFQLVDSECLMPSATDTTLYSKIHNNFKNSKVIYKPTKFASTEFAVAHYAGEVVYNVETFLEKNTDKLHADIVNLVKESKMELLQKVFTDPRFSPEQKAPAGGAADKSRARRTSSQMGMDGPKRERQNVTVGMMFREQLDRLVEDLNKTNPRYVRCIKPNALKQPGVIDSLDVLRQLRCAGMLESIRIRRAGYAVRRPFKDFFIRFRVLAPTLAAIGSDPDYRGLCQRLATEVEKRLVREGVALEEKAWQMGQTRLFMKEELERHFERLLVESAKRQVLTLQRRWRGYSHRRRFLAIRAAAVEVQAALLTRQAVAEFQELKRRHNASVLLQASLRAAAARVIFTRQRRASVTVQRFVRGWRCRSRLGQLKSKNAAEKLRRLREEEERQTELGQAREEARRKDAELEAMRSELEATTRRAVVDRQSEMVSRDAPQGEQQQNEELNKEEQQRFQEEQQRWKEDNEALAQKLKVAEQMVEENAWARKSAGDAELMKTSLRDYARQVEALQKANQALEEDLRQTSVGQVSAEQRLAETLRQLSETERHLKEVRERTPSEVSRKHSLSSTNDGARGVASKLDMSIAGLGGEPGGALDSLRSEIMARLGEASNGKHAVDPAHPLSTSLRAVLGDGVTPAFQSKDITEELARKTILNQREVFEKLKLQFSEAQGSASSRQLEQDADAHLEQQEGFLEGEKEADLEAEMRRLRRDNATLKTGILTAQEEATERASEASSLLEQVSTLQAEMEDMVYRHRGQEQTQRHQLEEATAALERQVGDLSRLSSRAQEAEGRVARYEVQAQQLKSDVHAKQDQLSQFEGSWQAVESLSKERDRLQKDLQNRENELANIREVLDNVGRQHAPVEELHRWKARAEELEQQFNQAMRYNREMSSAVGYMTHAASSQGGDMHELQLRGDMALKERDRKDQELKTAELEKKDLQAQIENVQSSCDYFQNKYKATATELRSAQKEQQRAAGGLAQAKAQSSELSREHEALRGRVSHLSQQNAEAQGRSQEQAQRLQASEDCLKQLLALHTEELESASSLELGNRVGQEQGLRERRDRARTLESRLKSLLNAASETARGRNSAAGDSLSRTAPAANARSVRFSEASSGMTHHEAYPSAQAKQLQAQQAQQQQQQQQQHQQQQQQQQQAVSGRASLLTQLNMSQHLNTSQQFRSP